jgi:hypothetical protein
MKKFRSFNFFSFLDLICCTLGATLLLLTIVNYQAQSRFAGRRSFAVTVQVQFAANGTKASPEVTVKGGPRELRLPAPTDAPDAKTSFFGRALVQEAPRPSYFFLCDVGTHADTYDVTIKQKGASGAAGDNFQLSDPVPLQEALNDALRSPVLRTLLDAADFLLEASLTPTETAPADRDAALRRLLLSIYPDLQKRWPGVTKLSAFVRQELGSNGQRLGKYDLRPVYLLLYIAAQLYESPAKAPVAHVRLDDFNHAMSAADADLLWQDVLDYTRLRMRPDGIKPVIALDPAPGKPLEILPSNAFGGRWCADHKQRPLKTVADAWILFGDGKTSFGGTEPFSGAIGDYMARRVTPLWLRAAYDLTRPNVLNVTITCSGKKEVITLRQGGNRWKIDPKDGSFMLHVQVTKEGDLVVFESTGQDGAWEAPKGSSGGPTP